MENKNDLISIIVPVYNVEKYLNRCIESIVSQSYKKLEIILVDDGSTDKSAQICDDWGIKDSRIKISHQQNGGVSVARNEGLSLTDINSKYVIFVDSDDYFIDSNAIMYLYSAILRGGELAANYFCDDYINLHIDHEKFCRFITSVYSYGPVEKIFLLDIIRKNNLCFDINLKSAEDTLFIRQYLKYCIEIQLINKDLYFYFQGNENSLTKKGYIDFCLYFEKKLLALEVLLPIINFTIEEKERFISERAIHGIKICFEHYYKNFTKDIYLKKFVDTIVAISPYVKTLSINNKKLLKWYKFVKIDKAENIYNKYFRFRVLMINHSLKLLASKIKKLILKRGGK